MFDVTTIYGGRDLQLPPSLALPRWVRELKALPLVGEIERGQSCPVRVIALVLKVPPPLVGGG